MIFEPGHEPGPPTRVGCVVVGLLLAVGAGWLVTALQKVRYEATRSACHGRNYQFGFAVQCFLDTDPGRRLPAGTLPVEGLPLADRLSWYVPVLPFCENGAVHRQLDLSAGYHAPANEAAVATPVRWFVCRTRRDGPATPTTDTVGVAGLGDDAADLPSDHPRAGAFGHDRRRAVSSAGFPDGLSHTLLLVEDGRDPGPWARGGWATVRGQDPTAGPPGVLHRRPGRPFGRGSAETIAILADGSYRLFTADTSPAVWAALATAAGGESVPAD